MSIPLRQNKQGYSLVEVVIIILIFSSMFLLMLYAFRQSIGHLNTTKAKIVGVEIANAHMEILHNLRYEDVGTVSGNPTGTLPDSREITRSNITFTVETDIIYIDDPFDGCVGEVVGEPDKSQCADGTIVDKPRDIPENENNPADYKKADITVTWNNYYNGHPIKLSSIIAPNDLEGETDKGFLLIKVINAAGQVVPGADVHITNTDIDPPIDIARTTNDSGSVLLLDMEPSNQTYNITVTKDGYSLNRTCPELAGGTACTDAAGVPDPVLGKVSVHQGEVETVYFTIDQVSRMVVNSYDENGVPLPTIDFTLASSLRDGEEGKKISYEPAPDGIVKTEIDFSTDASSTWNTNLLGDANQLEWDIYDLFIRTPTYYIAGINHNLALNILPNTDTTLNVFLDDLSDNSTTNALLVTVIDNNEVGVAGAEVELRLATDPPGDLVIDPAPRTGEGFIRQTDWSGGDGQADFTDQTMYFSDNAHIDEAATAGEVTLWQNTPALFHTESFSDATYKDDTNTTADWNTADQELKLPTSGSPYPTAMHYAQTTKLNTQHGNITSATLTANETPNGQTIEYYISADGGTNFEPVTLGTAHVFSNVGDDIRVRIELTTADANTTPLVSDFTLNYTVEYYDQNGELTSSTFDLSAAATFTDIHWGQGSQPADTTLTFQIATNTDNATWNFIGPDGTASTYYTANNADLHASHDGDQYVRYKAFLETADVAATPTMTEVRIGYTLSHFPPGQVYYNNLEAADYGMAVCVDADNDGTYCDGDLDDVEETYTVTVNGYTTYITNPPLTLP